MANQKGRQKNKNFFDNMYQDPFDSPRANPKHASHQVNGETQQSQTGIKIERQVRSRA
ncbi:YpzG family protein [Thalassobacillus hwangdonensis]|uniref:YpzG family protein n=1 Tax=Thalassobacillus hwangdonensis TaxID=546108 RepID=A0ABW3L470_9BACI